MVVADTGPINYLILVGHIDVLRSLLEIAVRSWIAAAPSWFVVRPSPPTADPALAKLRAGEKAAIALALELRA